METGQLLSFCNPLLDISANVPAEVIEKYEAPRGNACLAEEKQMPVYKDLLENYNVELIAGGSAQNTMRVCQWMLQSPNVTKFSGCVGEDEYASMLRKSAESDGVSVHYMVNKEHPTGTCACLIEHKERALIANLGAANHYHHDFLQTPEMQEAINKAKYFYISGYFLTVSPETISYICKHAHENNKVVMMNMSALFIMSVFKDRVLELLPYADYVFGNNDEALEFAKANGLDTTNIEEIAQKLANWTKVNTQRERVVVVTQGKSPAIVATKDSIKHFEQPILPSEKIVDTNGAGDAFVGGWLSQYLQGKPLEDSMRAASYAAQYIIQTSGTKLEGTPNFN